ncbi:MAG: PAS domain-containing protein [Gemmatimonadaceae bacterium]|nr:PAS domain-containing protein [Gemmatimonadaceae bacterium]
MPDSSPSGDAAAALPPFRPLSPEQVALLEWSPNPKLVLDRQFRVRYVNAAATIYGATDHDALVGKNIWDAYPALRNSIFHRAYQEVLDTGASARFERHDLDRDRWHSVYAYPADDGVVAVLEDITEQRRIVDRLRRNEEMLVMAQEAANIGSFELNTASNQWLWSDQLVRLMGHDPATLDQRRIGNDPDMKFTHPDDTGSIQQAIRRAAEAGTKQALQARIVRPNGDVRHMHITIMRVDGSDEASSRLVGTALDITDQVQAEAERTRIDAQMQQAQKLESLGVLAGGIAHDFNNLLVGILGNASLALLDSDVPPALRECLHEIERSAQKAAELTRQLLAYAGKGRYHVESLDATATIDDMASLLRTAIARNASLYFELPDQLPPLEADLNQFRQVVMTLVTNASDALEERAGVISVVSGVQEVTADYLTSCVPGSAAEPGRFVFVEVRDTGTGMDPATRQRMFEPFFSTKFTGRGLGLAATMGIMRGHRGAIRVYSEVGSGTSVKLLFPISHADTTHVPHAPDEDWSGEGHILVVDDEENVRTVATALLRRRGFSVSVARDGLEAVSLFNASPNEYALVLLDLTMPHLNGEETLRALRQRRPDIGVLLMSGYNESDVSRMFAGRELSGFLQKPFNAAELYSSISLALSDERIRREK